MLKITYIHHSSFLVELDEAAMLFDYYEGELPAVAKEKPLFVFASHRHSDHFSSAIFRLGDGRALRYILSDDIPARRVPEAFRDRTDRMGPGQIRKIRASEAPEIDLTVETLRSTDEGVAFLVTCCGLTLYHAGDLNNWVWAGESQAYNRQMEQSYHEELDKLRGRGIDVAFLPLDPRQESDFYRGMDDFMVRVGAKHVFPMHFWGDFNVSRQLKSMPCASAYGGQIVDISRRGEPFTL